MSSHQGARGTEGPPKKCPSKKNIPFIKYYTGYYMKMLSAMLSRKRSCPLEKLPTRGPLKNNEGTQAAQKKNSLEQSRKESKGKAKKKREAQRKGQVRKGTVKE